VLLCDLNVKHFQEDKKKRNVDVAANGDTEVNASIAMSFDPIQMYNTNADSF
jgi:hypothetical protein